MEPGRCRITPEMQRLRTQLRLDAERARREDSPECRQAWVDPLLWSEYMGRTGRRLYASFTDEELLCILRRTAAELGHPPSQREVFCVYRSYIRRRFVNWPSALRAAGLKRPKEQKNPSKSEE